MDMARLSAFPMIYAITPLGGVPGVAIDALKELTTAASIRSEEEEMPKSGLESYYSE